MNLKGILPYLILPLGISIYEIATLVVMSTHSLDSITLSVYQPQNAFISMFWYDGFENVLMLISLVVLSELSLIYLPAKQKYFRAILILILSFIVGYLANLKWLSSDFTYSTLGQSGVVYAMFGVITFVLLFDSIYLFSKRNYRLMFRNMLVVTLFVMVGLSNFSTFFSVSSFTNYFVHEHAFIYGIIAGAILSVTEGFVMFVVRENYGSFVGGI
jgi:hypothetical protein